MGKTRRGGKEHSREQKLTHENKQLKRENARLRKELARLDLDRYDTVRELIEEHTVQNPEQSGDEWLESLKKTWSCRECNNGYLQIFLFNKVGTLHYYRVCSNAPTCKNRTKSQRYDSSQVKGIIKKETE